MKAANATFIIKTTHLIKVIKVKIDFDVNIKGLETISGLNTFIDSFAALTS